MSETPMMRQYQQAKRAHPDALLLFRMGDFYELFFDDAKQASQLLGLAITSREKGENAIPMAGFPYHQLESYLGKIVSSGLRAAICEQVQDPKEAKGLVQREVVRVVSPGTITDDALLNPRESNFLAAVFQGKEPGLAWIDISTGLFQATATEGDRLADELARIAPAEILLNEEAEPLSREIVRDIATTRRPAWTFSANTAREALTSQFGTATLEGFGFGDEDLPAIRAAGAILKYLEETQKGSLQHIDRLLPYRRGERMEIDIASRRSLELHRTLREGARETSLLGVIDRTVTAMGSRMLAEWIDSPLARLAAINDRLEATEELVKEQRLLSQLREELRGIHDLERLLARVTTGRASPRDVSFLGRTLQKLPKIKSLLACRRSSILSGMEMQLELCGDLRTAIDAALIEDCPLTSREGNFIRDGFSSELDSLRELMTGGKKWLAEFQAEEIQRTGISNLKIGFNKVFGYYLEVLNSQSGKIPANYIRKQTVKNSERYITPELKEHEEKVLRAEDRAHELEYELFVELRNKIAASAPKLRTMANLIAQLDVHGSLAELAVRRNYCRPTLSESNVLQIKDGRHPVLDVMLPEATFVPNDIEMNDAESLLLITGPNMAGKSTYIRQAALLVLLAQIGSFVPAAKAEIGIADRIFARVGANDELARGQSTFMVEMTETARILHNATKQSLVILDEIGRGTSTYDGVSLAWAITEYLHDRIGCRTLFATHYHELTDLKQTLPNLKNLNVAVREWQDQVVFLHKILDGCADKSYGIHVARLAGIPLSVIERSKQVLAHLEQDHMDAQGRPKLSRRKGTRVGELQLTLFGPAEHPILDDIRSLDLNQMTPLSALELLHQWREQLSPAKKKELPTGR